MILPTVSLNFEAVFVTAHVSGVNKASEIPILVSLNLSETLEKLAGFEMFQLNQVSYVHRNRTAKINSTRPFKFFHALLIKFLDV